MTHAKIDISLIVLFLIICAFLGASAAARAETSVIFNPIYSNAQDPFAGCRNECTKHAMNEAQAEAEAKTVERQQDEAYKQATNPYAALSSKPVTPAKMSYSSFKTKLSQCVDACQTASR